MLRFNKVPPTAETTDVDPDLIRFLAYGPEDRCINSVAEVCASIVYDTADNYGDIISIGEKIGEVIANNSRSKNPEADSTCFVKQYVDMIQILGQKAAKTFVKV